MTSSAQTPSVIMLNSMDGGSPIELQGEIIVGRGSMCDVILDNDRLSRQHARLSVGDGNLLVEDLGSTNGTFINDVRLDGPTLVKHRDILCFDRLAYEVCVVGMDNAEAAIISQDVAGQSQNYMASNQNNMNPNQNTMDSNRNTIGLNQQSAMTPNQNAMNSGQNTINSGQNTINSSQNTINSSQNTMAPMQNPMDSNQSMMNPNQNTMGSNQNMMNPNQNAMGSNQNMMSPNQSSVDPNQNMMNPNQNTMGSNQNMMDPNQNTMGSNQNMMNPNQNTVGTNQNMMNPNQNTMGGGQNVIEPSQPNMGLDVLVQDAEIVDAKTQLFTPPKSWALEEKKSSDGTQVMSLDMLQQRQRATATDDRLVDLVDAECPVLVGLSGAVKGKVFKFNTRSKMTKWEIGRDESCDIHIDEGSVSNNHAQLIHEGARWKLIDLMSANGTYVNGAKGLTSYLTSGDKVSFGQAEFAFRLGEDDDEQRIYGDGAGGFKAVIPWVFGGVAFAVTAAVLFYFLV